MDTPVDTQAKAILDLQGIGKSFRGAGGVPRTVLEGVDFRLADGEIVALLGQSGSGKSTLLRIMAGLIPADQGVLTYGGKSMHGPARGIGMVFQSFALFPWLTVQQNVELGMEARGVAPGERAKKAEAAIALIGLSGFEGALPRELSGGMRQRVGIARALVTEPNVLLMDEAFSALDVLTAERLRDEILELWEAGQFPARAILVVSHNIEEAVMMADRVVVFDANPGRIRAELAIDLPRPRDADSLEIRERIDEVYALMTGSARRPARTAAAAVPAWAEVLPDADVGRMEAVLELLMDEPFRGIADLPQFAAQSELPDEELLPAAEALRQLGLVHMARGDITATPLGRRYCEGDNALRQELFGQQLIEHVPLVAHIRNGLEEAPNGELREERLLGQLTRSLDEASAARTLSTVIEWARYGEVFEYDYPTGTLSLPDGRA
ncbi:nitrate/sulfonate/bicarbonate ABC transporter ATP-binding protein [Niveibacterium sp. SC-1]|uniref:ABC transporter ATP-binding protein n=1 Tax=Niveibacterium sp. SC-1 TaxID=3135646 RepID=UPI00311EF806